MGTQLIPFLKLAAPPFTSLPLLNLNKTLNTTRSANTNIVRCSSTGSSQTGGQFRFDSQNSDDVDDEFEFSSSRKQRIWWSDFDDYDDVWDLDEDDEFWVFKVFRAFGWMVPAIAISLLLGSGPNAFIMALAVPLGQSALSLVFDKVSRRTSKRWKSTSSPKAKKKHSTRAPKSVRTNKRKQEANRNGGEKATYSSWLNMDGDLHDKGAKRGPKFGGWDQLDDQVETQKRAPSQKGNGLPKQQKKGKFGRIGRVRDTPLLLRVLIAVFPFLGSWTRFLF
ncbi:PREDICTED: uncharacterized protein LOC18600027 [Theobroma cacao]|uniref:Uncharacterized protein LOC18600027 n=1 Tax=Theobroma cacao TaxID=3641 RepID=A0AB32V545_THECC|nr:PREDICTED: uncharacterized protein LOC18600027 [Theobroma cacao]